MYSPACLTCVVFLSSYERTCSAPLLCEREKDIRQVLQSVVQCTETAGAAHQGSMGWHHLTSVHLTHIPPPSTHLRLLTRARPCTGQRGRTGPGGCSQSRAVTLRQVGRRWGKDGGGGWCSLTHQHVFWRVCRGLISVKRMQALSTLYMTAVRWEISRTQRAIKPVESRVGTRLEHGSA